MTELPELGSYDPSQLERASEWPAVERYLSLLKRATKDSPDAKTKIRIARHEHWLKCAIATYFDRAPAETICKYWSEAAEELIKMALAATGADKSNACVLALGKLGASELNLSSDVDLIFVRADGPPVDPKPLREFQNLLTDLTEYGFALRVDLDLRPGGRSAAMVPSSSEFEYHYGYHGEMWERLAYVRMRVIAGPEPLAASIRDFSKKFSFRRHLDYTLLDELKALRSKIRQEKFEKRPGTFHLKLGEGGIRELELFVHALQVIHGGRNTLLQTNSTSEALRKIRELGLLPENECDFLFEAYWYLRDLENRLHAYEDQQTYLIDIVGGHPALPEGFAPKLQATCQRVSEIATSLFGKTETDTQIPEELSSQKEWLKANGFSEGSCDDTWPALLAATALSQKSERDEQARMAFLMGFVSKLAENRLDRDLGLSLLLDFVKAIRAKASFFTLLNRETKFRDELAMLFSISPYLASILTSRPELIDEFIFRKLAAPSEDMDTLLEELAERRLLSELIAATQYLADRELTKMSYNLTANADAITTLLLERLVAEYGPSPIGLLPLGKWGGRELGLRSDLDFVFTIPHEPTPADHKVAKRFLSRITEPHRGGSIYAVDMRLRPSGNAGPIMVRTAELERYLRESAAAWERQAYLRSRPLGTLDFQPARAACERGLSPEDLNELRMIRSKLFKDEAAGELDLKLTHGSLADVEFTAQIALLARREFSLDPSTSGMIQYLEGVDASWRDVGPGLRAEYEALRRIEQLYQLTTSQSGSKLRSKSDEFRRLALVLGESPEDLEARIRSSFRKIMEGLRGVRTL